MLKTIKSNLSLIIIILIGLFLRSYKPLTLFQYSHDHDLAGWFVHDVLINHHIRLIGQETSSHGIFIGPYFYYLQIPFYMLTHLDPAGSLLLPIILGTFAIWSMHFVLNKMFNGKVARVGALIYATSTLIVFTDREIVPTMPVMLWTIWFLYCLWLILKGKKNAYILLSILVGFIWSINLQLVILIPLVLIAQFLSKKKINFKELIVDSLIVLALNLPFFGFEVRHGFQQTRALIDSLTTNKDYIAGTASGFLPRLDRTMQLVYKNTTNLFGANILNLDPKIMFWVLILTLTFLVYKKIIDKKLGAIFFLWIFTYILFFTKISLNISEYYLNGMNIVFILIAAMVIKEFKILGMLLITLFAILNLYSFFTKPINANGYVERKAIIQAIKENANARSYPCVSLSFITSPGNNLGYRYFTYKLGLKTKPVSGKIPVYTIVFPLNLVKKFDNSFGSLGLVLPEYKRYNLETIQKACKGDDYTTTEPMFGFTN